MIFAEFGSTGALEISVFHKLLERKGTKPFNSFSCADGVRSYSRIEEKEPHVFSAQNLRLVPARRYPCRTFSPDRYRPSNRNYNGPRWCGGAGGNCYSNQPNHPAGRERTESCRRKLRCGCSGPRKLSG